MPPSFLLFLKLGLLFLGSVAIPPMGMLCIGGDMPPSIGDPSTVFDRFLGLGLVGVM